MTITLKDLKHFELMANLEQRKVKVVEEVKPLEVKSFSLTENLLILTSKLRKSGYLKQADNLENSIGRYKKAESQDIELLYKAQPDTKIMEVAHPEGDVGLCPAKDELGVVETNPSQHEKILKAIEAKAEVINLLKKSLNIKTAEESLSEKQAGFDKFKKITSSIIAETERMIAPLSSDKYKDIKIPSKKKLISDYLLKIDRLLNGTRKSVSIYGGYLQSNAKNEKLEALQWPDALLKELIILGTDIHDSFAAGELEEIKDKSKVGFDNKEYSSHIISLTKALQHQWLSFWGEYGEGDRKDREYHSKFLTSDMLLETFKPLQIKNASIKQFINEFLLNQPQVKQSSSVSGYLTKLIGYIDLLGSELNNVISETYKFANTNEFYGSKDITMDLVKRNLKDPSLSKLDFSSLESFNSGLNVIYKTITAKLLQLVNTNTVFDSNRDEIIRDINLRLAKLG